MSDELIGGMIKGVVMAISLSLIGLLLFYVLNIIKKVLFKAKKTVTPLSKAVYNHSKDIVNDIKPAINEYKEKHSITKTENEMTQSLNSEINEDEIYEKIMIEIEQDNKVKSTWAKALSQSDGNKDKAESLYISMRFEELKYHQSYQKEELNLKDNQQIKNIGNEKEVETKKDSSSKTIVSLISLISFLLFACIIIFSLIYFNLNKDASTTTNETLSKESTYSSKVQNNTTSNEKLISSNKIEKQENTNKNSFQTIFEYKDWKYESFDNFSRITTNGKVGAPGHEFGIIRGKEQCNNNFPVPLQFSEYKAIAKSISNWTWKHYGNRSGKDWIYYVKKTHSVELQSWRGKQNTPEQQAIKGRLGGLANTPEQQAIKGRIGGSKNSKEHLSAIGKLAGSGNTSEQQREKALKSAKVRFEGSNEQLKPWLDLGISRSYYYKQKKLGLI